MGRCTGEDCRQWKGRRQGSKAVPKLTIVFLCVIEKIIVNVNVVNSVK